MILTIRRTFMEALRNFWRNGWLSFATIVVLTMSLYIFGTLFLASSYAKHVVKTVEEKINVSVYFRSDVPEEDILKAKDDLQKFNEISSVEYISKDQAIETFKKNNAGEPVIIKSLEVIGGNPLLASLVVRAQSPDKYDAIVSYISEGSFRENVSRVNYEKNKEVIEKINVVMSDVTKFGMVLVGMLALIAVLITFNTIRLTIYAHRQEIEVMRLVGASNTFIRLPFIFEGIIYGAVASTVSFVAIFVTTRFVIYNISPKISQTITGIFWADAAMIFFAELALGAALGILSSMISIRKYLKV